MRILFANTLYPTAGHPRIVGGAETFSKRLCEALVDRGHAVQVVRAGPAWRSWTREISNGVNVATLPTQNLYSPWENRSPAPLTRAGWHFIEDRSPAAPQLDAIIREFRPDVLHSNNFPGLTVGIWSKTKKYQIPIVHTLHDYYLTCARSIRFTGGARCFATCRSCKLLTRRRRRATSLIDTVVSVSRRTLDIHHDCGLFHGARGAVIRNWPPTVENSRPGLEVVADKVVFGFIGRPSIEKGVFELVSAFAKLQAGKARLIIAGKMDEPMRARLLADARGADVQFLGFVKPEEFYHRIDVAVIPSIWEDPCPMVIGESFAFARPVVGARRGGIAELIDDDRAGWLYEPGRGELAGLLAEIAADRAAIIAKSSYLARKTGRRSFDDLVSGYLSVYAATTEHQQGECPGRRSLKPVEL